MWNEIFKEMGLQYVEDEKLFDMFKKFLHRSFLVMFWTIPILVMKYKKKRGWTIDQ